MSKFSEYLEQLMVVMKPSSDAVSEVKPVGAIPVDMFTGAANDIMSTLQPPASGIQPDSTVGETGNESKNEDEPKIKIEKTENGVTIDIDGLSVEYPESVMKAIIDFAKENMEKEDDSDKSDENKDEDDDAESKDEASAES